MSTVLVTGGTGYIGGWCIVELLKRGHTVRTTIRSLTKEAAVRRAIATQVDPGERLKFFAATLTEDSGWDEAVAGCDYVLHVASPLGTNVPKNPDDLIVPARDGTLRVLKAATQAAVKGFVFTSSVAASSPGPNAPDGNNDETLWTNPEAAGLTAYRKSKTLAEKAAWDFMEKYTGPTTFTAILPSAVLGPVLTRENLGSVQLVSRLLDGSFPGNPRLGFNIIDVRDLADLHIRAMNSPEAAGQRLIASADFMWLKDISQMLRAELGVKANKVPTRGLPDFVLKFIALFDRTISLVTPDLGKKHTTTSAKAQRLLNWKPRPAKETIIDCANSLLD
ncbi:MAG: aldehyde reductase [Candidatus Obscuribacterales bacterium]|jgi:nucleoside-diphosphate-sugar epimerase